MFIIILFFYFLIKKTFLKNVFFIKKKNNIPIEVFFKNFKNYFNFNINNILLNQLFLKKNLILIYLEKKYLYDDFFSKKKFFYKFTKNINWWKLKNIKIKNFFQYKINNNDCSSMVRV